MFWCRLSVAYGRPVSELQREMSSSDFVEMMAYSQLEPFGPYVETQHAAMIAATVANFSGRSKRRMRVEDFMPKRRQLPQTADEQFAILRAFSK